MLTALSFHCISTDVSESDVLNLIPPGVSYYHQSDRASATATINRWRRTPEHVVSWDGFLGNVESYSPSDDPVYKMKDFKSQPNVVITNERDLETALSMNVYRLLRQLAGPQEQFSRPNVIPTRGDPDFIFFNTSPSLLLAIEVKTKHILSPDNLVQKYNSEMALFNADKVPSKSTVYQVRQIFGYLSWNELQYGVLTTYEQTWFLKRNRGTLYVSPAIHYAKTNPTLFKCYACIMELARQHPSNPPTPPPSPSPPDSPSHDNPDDSDYDSKGRNKRKRGTRSNEGLFQSKRQKGGSGSRGSN